MALEFINIEPKTGERLANVPDRVAEHTYLEYRIQQAQAAGQLPEQVTLYVAKLVDGVNEADLHHLRATQGLHSVGSNRRSAYLVGDEQTANWIQNEIFTNHSDPVAYFSVVMSHAVASTVKPNARVLVIDDGEPVEASGAKKWGRKKPKDRSGNAVDVALLDQAHRLLGDGYCLVSPELHREVGRAPTVEKAHSLVDEGKLSFAQVQQIPSSAISAWEEAEVRSALAFHLEETIGRSLPASEAQALSAAAIAELQSPLQISKPKLEADPIRGEVATARWRYSDLSSNVTYTGRVMLERRPVEQGANLELTMIGGTHQQKATVAAAFEAIANSDLTPFQLRGGVPEWKGAIKGTSRAATLCEQIGVDAIVPKSAIKADGKTVPLGVNEVSELFWARKSDARAGTQRLGTQVLVNLPQGTEADILPKLAIRLDELAEATHDPRKLAELYCQSYERRQQYSERSGEFEDEAGTNAQEGADFKTAGSSSSATRTDWLYELLKVDARVSQVVEVFDAAAWTQQHFPSLEPATAALWNRKLQGIEAELNRSMLTPDALRTLVADTLQIQEQNPEHRSALDALKGYTETTEVGGYGQLLEMPKVVERLNEFVQAQWQDSATGGVTIPSATAQPHRQLERGEICTTNLPHGARVAAYRSPVANVGQMKVLTNNLSALREHDPEAFAQVGVVYMNPDDAKEMVIDFDIDSVGLAPEEAYSRARIVKTKMPVALEVGQCYIPSLPVGQAVTLYHSGDQVMRLVNTEAALPEDAPRGKQAVYLSQQQMAEVDPKQPAVYGFYDGLHGFKSLVNEVEALIQPEVCPPAVEKRTKIPRDANHPDVAKLSPEDQAIAARFTTLEQAMVHAADNPTGIVANAGMRLQAIKQHLDTSTSESQIQQVKEASKTFQRLLSREGVESPGRETFIVPDDLSNGYSVRAEMSAIANLYKRDTKCDKLIAQLQQQDDADLLATVSQIQKHFDRIIKGSFSDTPKPVYPDRRPGEYDFKAAAEWIQTSSKSLNASSEAGRAAQARQVIVPKMAQFLSALNGLGEEHHENLRKLFTNYTSWDKVKGYELSRPDQEQAALVAVPRLRKLLEVTQHQLLDTQLQSAVETDKSARPVDQDILYFAQSIATYQPIDWVKGKKREDAYLTAGETLKPMANNTLDPVGRMVEQTNQYYSQSEPVPTLEISVYNSMVPKPVNPELHSSARSLAAEYNKTINQFEAIERDAKENAGVKLTVTSPQLPVPLTVTNLMSFDPKGESPIWQAIREQKPVYLQIVPNDTVYGIAPKDSNAWKTQGALETAPTHDYQVIGMIADEQGRLESYSIGTLDRTSERELRKAIDQAKSDAEQSNQAQVASKRPILKKAAQKVEAQMEQKVEPVVATPSVEQAEETLPIDLANASVFGSSEHPSVPIRVTKLNLSPNYDREMAEEMLNQAEAEVRLWAEAIQPEDRAEAFRGLYHANLCPETGMNTSGTNGRHLALKLFPELMTPHLQQFSLTQGKVVGLNHNVEHTGLNVQWQGQRAAIRAAVCDQPELPIHNQVVWQVGIDEPIVKDDPNSAYQRQWYTLGKVEENTARPPIGVEAVAQIESEARYQIRLKDGVPVTIVPNQDEAVAQLLKAHCHDPEQPITLSFQLSPFGDKATVYAHLNAESEPIQVGRLERGMVNDLKQHAPHLAQKKQDIALKGKNTWSGALGFAPARAAAITILPETVQRPQQWCKPTLQSWQRFTESQPPTVLEKPVYSREGLTNPRSLEPQVVGGGGVDVGSSGVSDGVVNGDAVDKQHVAAVNRIDPEVAVPMVAPVSAPSRTVETFPKLYLSVQQVNAQERAEAAVSGTGTSPRPSAQQAAAEYRSRYQATAQTLQPRLQEAAVRRGKPLSMEEQDQAVAVWVMSQTAGDDTAKKTEATRVLWQSPISQKVMAEQGKEAMCDYLKQTINEADAKIKATKARAPQDAGLGR